MTTIKAVERPEDDRQVLRLDTEAARIVAFALLIEWETQAKEVAREVNEAIGQPDRREMHAADAAWKVRRQAVIVDMLEQLRVVA